MNMTLLAYKALGGVQFRRGLRKLFYITTPIFYVNGKPHLGHLYSMLIADVRKRWENLRAERLSFLLTGTDEHGLKIQMAAEKLNVAPKRMVDGASKNFRVLAELFDINYDRFIRTTDLDHKETVEHFWNYMMEKGLIYEGEHEGWYSISDETFFPDLAIEEIDKNGDKIKISKETRNEVFKMKELNYCFSLSKFQSQLIEYLESNPSFILPRSKHAAILKELKENKLSDLSVSRPSSRLQWGIEVPGDPSQRIYVWFDALLNYVSAAGFPSNFSNSGLSMESKPNCIWPATHVIGKDIIRFHCIYWPIFLLAARIELPKQVIVHAHWLSEGFKMSKSLGNVVDPIETLQHYGQDALRFFLAANSNLENDSNFVEKDFYFTRERLVGKYANLMTRCGSPNFNIERSVERFSNGEFANIFDTLKQYNLATSNASDLSNQIQDYIISMDEMGPLIDSKIEEFDLMRAANAWWTLVERANQVFQMGEPWVYSKKVKQDSKEEEKKSYILIQDYLVFLASEGCRVSSILASAFIPSLSGNILNRLGVSQDRRTLNEAKFGGDLHYGTGSNTKGHPVPIERIPMRQANTS